MNQFDWIVGAVIALILAVLLLSGCSLQAAFSMKCKGECEIEVERGVEVKAPSPIPLEK